MTYWMLLGSGTKKLNFAVNRYQPFLAPDICEKLPTKREYLAEALAAA